MIVDSDPLLSTLFAVYRTSKTIYNISNEAYEEYMKTKDTSVVAQKIAKRLMKHTVSIGKVKPYRALWILVGIQ